MAADDCSGTSKAFKSGEDARRCVFSPLLHSAVPLQGSHNYQGIRALVPTSTLAPSDGHQRYSNTQTRPRGQSWSSGGQLRGRLFK